MFIDSTILAARLSAVEKMQIRGANPGRLEWLFNNIYRYEIDLPREAAMKMFTEVQNILIQQLTENSKTTGFGRTWAF